MALIDTSSGTLKDLSWLTTWASPVMCPPQVPSGNCTGGLSAVLMAAEVENTRTCELVVLTHLPTFSSTAAQQEAHQHCIYLT